MNDPVIPPADESKILAAEEKALIKNSPGLDEKARDKVLSGLRQDIDNANATALRPAGTMTPSGEVCVAITQLEDQLAKDRISHARRVKSGSDVTTTPVTFSFSR